MPSFQAPEKQRQDIMSRPRVLRLYPFLDGVRSACREGEIEISKHSQPRKFRRIFQCTTGQRLEIYFTNFPQSWWPLYIFGCRLVIYQLRCWTCWPYGALTRSAGKRWISLRTAVAQSCACTAVATSATSASKALVTPTPPLVRMYVYNVYHYHSVYVRTHTHVWMLLSLKKIFE